MIVGFQIIYDWQVLGMNGLFNSGGIESSYIWKGTNVFGRRGEGMQVWVAINSLVL